MQRRVGVMNAEIHGARGRVAQILRDEPSALEVLVGPQCYLVDFIHASCIYTFPVAVLTLVVSLLVGSSIPGFHPLPLVTLAGVGIVVAPAIYLWVTEEWPLGALLTVGLVLAVAFVTGIGLAGPRVGEEAALLPGTIVAAVLWLSRRWAVANVGIYALGYAVIVGTQPGYDHPVARWIFVIGVSASVASILHWIIEKIRRLAAAESEARSAAERAHSALAVAHNELASWSHTLEERVEAQVAEIEGLSRLGRLLPPRSPKRS